jgi:hypothetical protein
MKLNTSQSKTNVVGVNVRHNSPNGLKTRRNLFMKNVTVVTEQLKAEMVFAELLFATGNELSFTGELLAINPTKEEFATFNSNFKHAVEAGMTPDIVDGVVYYDTGADRAYIVPEAHVEITEVN